MPAPPNNPRFQGGENMGRNASGAASSIGNALQGLGGAVSGVGDQLHQKWMHLKVEEENAQLRVEEGQVDMAEAKFHQWTLNHQDTEEWAGQLDHEMSLVSEALSEKGGSPALKRARGRMLARKKSAAGVRAYAQGGMMKAKQINDSYEVTAMLLGNKGDFTGQQEILLQHHASGFLSDASYGLQMAASNKAEASSYYETLSTSNMEEGMTRLEKDDNFSPMEKLTLARGMQTRSNRETAEARKAMATRFESRPLNSISPEEMRSWPEMQVLSKESQEALVNGMLRSGASLPLDAKQVMGLTSIIERVRAYRQGDGTDPNYSEAEFIGYFNDMKKVFDGHYVQGLDRELYAEMMSLNPTSAGKAVSLFRKQEGEEDDALTLANFKNTAVGSGLLKLNSRHKLDASLGTNAATIVGVDKELTKAAAVLLGRQFSTASMAWAKEQVDLGRSGPELAKEYKIFVGQWEQDNITTPIINNKDANIVPRFGRVADKEAFLEKKRERLAKLEEIQKSLGSWGGEASPANSWYTDMRLVPSDHAYLPERIEALKKVVSDKEATIIDDKGNIMESEGITGQGLQRGIDKAKFDTKNKTTSTGESFSVGRVTGYWPAPEAEVYKKFGSGAEGKRIARMEGGPVDRKGKAIWNSHTLEDFESGKSDYVAVAMDSGQHKYGTYLTSPNYPGILFRVVDTGGAFEGKGNAKMDIATNDYSRTRSKQLNQKGVTFNVVTKS